METQKFTNKPVTIPSNEGGIVYSIRQVRTLIVQNVMAYNNTQSLKYWKKRPTALLHCNVGPADRPYLMRLLELAVGKEKDKLKDKQSKSN